VVPVVEGSQSAVTTRARYWCDRKLLITLDGPEGRSSTTIERPFARVGSHESSEIVLRDKRVRPRSLYLHATEGGIFCVNLAPSYFGKPSSRGWLHPEQRLTLGPYQLSARLSEDVQTPGDSGSDLEAKGSAVAPFPVVAATVQDEEIGRRLLTRQLTLIGRHRSSKIRLTSHTVSASHCVMYWDSGTLWVVDLLSGNGTQLDGQPVDVVELPLGCCLKLGHVDLTYVTLSDSHPADFGEHLPRNNAPGVLLGVSPVEPEVSQIAPEEEEYLEDTGAAWEEERARQEQQFTRRLEELVSHEAELV